MSILHLLLHKMGYVLLFNYVLRLFNLPQSFHSPNVWDHLEICLECVCQDTSQHPYINKNKGEKKNQYFSYWETLTTYKTPTEWSQRLTKSAWEQGGERWAPRPICGCSVFLLNKQILSITTCLHHIIKFIKSVSQGKKVGQTPAKAKALQIST